jgi:asparagine synthase (glutamine-hydrolysing)
MLHQSVEDQLIADARVGVLCSGGVDSSLMLAMAARSHDNLAVFHADVVGPTSEYDAAKDLAGHLGLDLQVTKVQDGDFIDLLPALTRHHGSPYLVNPHSVPFYRVSQLVRDSGVKAVLSGEGADEAFLGYAWAVPGRTQRRSHRVASNPSRTLLAQPGRRGSPNARLVDLMTAMLEVFTTDEEHSANVSAVADGTYEGTIPVQTLDLLHANLRGLLHRNDTMGMAASVESRFPFLDTRLVECAVNLPARAKMRRRFHLHDRQHPLTLDKWVIRKVADRYLPRQLSRRPKVPFATTAYGRLVVSPGLFDNGFLADLFNLGRPQIEYLLEQIGSRVSRLVHLETWGRVYALEESDDLVLQKLRDNVSLSPLG